MITIRNITKTGMLLAIATISQCITQASPSGNTSHGSGGAHGGGGSGGGLPYPTASTVSQLISDVNYANSAGGAITINLAPGTTFDLTSANNSTDGGNGFPVIGGTKAVNVTITGNGDTIDRTAVLDRWGNVKNPFRLFDVAVGSSLTLDHVTVTGGDEGAILNRGTLNLSDAIVSGNGNNAGGGIDNEGGTVTVNSSVVSSNIVQYAGGGIYNNAGTVTISNSTLTGNYVSVNGDMSDTYGGAVCNNGGTVTIDNSIISGNSSEYGGGIGNLGGTVTIGNSTISTNKAYFFAYDGRGGLGGAIYIDSGTVTIDKSTLSGNSADIFGGGVFDGGFYSQSSATLVVRSSTISSNTASGTGYEFYGYNSGGGIYIYNNGTATVENSSNITGNTFDDIQNSGTLYLYLNDNSTITSFDGNPAVEL